MKVQLVAVGNKMPSWVDQGYQEYAKRLPRELLPSLTEIPVGHRAKNINPSEAMAKESAAIRKAIPEQNFKIFLHTRGKAWSTPMFAQKLADWQMAGRDISFVIGGPDGYSSDCLALANATWCMSELTLPHPVVRIVFIEQLYRAWSILQNHPYHK